MLNRQTRVAWIVAGLSFFVTVHGLFPRSSPVPAQHLGPATSLAIQNVVVGVSRGLRGLRFRRYDEIHRTPFL